MSRDHRTERALRPEDMAGLPPLHARWLAEVLPGAIANEAVATCSTCVMVPTEPADKRSPGHFSADTKCCTYLPQVPNFLVGRALQAGGISLATMSERIRRRSAVTPLGVGRTRSYELLYERAGERAFGRARTLRCPHYQADLGGACGIWESRNGVCSTWFCKHVRGDVGGLFWSAVRDLLVQVESALAIWCVLELRIEPSVLRKLLAVSRPTTVAHLDDADIDMSADPDHEQHWGDWLGTESEHYSKCADLVAPLAWSDVERIAGARLRASREILLEAYRKATDNSLPRSARAGTYRAVESGRQVVKLVTYSDFDPVELPRELHEALPEFDGRTLDSIVDEIARERGIVLTADLVRRLIDFGVLVAED